MAKVRCNPFAERIAAEGIVHDQKEKRGIRRKDFVEALRRVIKGHDAAFRKLARS